MKSDRALVRRMLWQWGSTMDRVRNMQADIRGLHDLIDGLRTPSGVQRITGMPGSGQVGDPTARTAERAMELTRTYHEAADIIEARIKDALRLKRAVDDAVAARLTPIQSQVVTMRYQGGHGWEYIALKLAYAESLVRQREAEAVDNLAKIISTA